MQVVLLFPHCFWGEGVDMFGRVAESTAQRGKFFLIYSYAHISGSNLPHQRPLFDAPLCASVLVGDWRPLQQLLEVYSTPLNASGLAILPAWFTLLAPQRQ